MGSILGENRKKPGRPIRFLPCLMNPRARGYMIYEEWTCKVVV